MDYDRSGLPLRALEEDLARRLLTGEDSDATRPTSMAVEYLSIEPRRWPWQIEQHGDVGFDTGYLPRSKTDQSCIDEGHKRETTSKPPHYASPPTIGRSEYQCNGMRTLKMY